MLPRFWVVSTKPEAALARGQGWWPWQERGWALAPRDRGPEAGVYCLEGHSGVVTGVEETDEAREARIEAIRAKLERGEEASPEEKAFLRSEGIDLPGEEGTAPPAV
jgi:hypothetical protein